MAIDIYSSPFTAGSQIDDRLNMTRHTLTGYEITPLTVSDGTTTNISDTITLDADSYYMMKGIAQITWHNAADAAVLIDLTNVDYMAIFTGTGSTDYDNTEGANFSAGTLTWDLSVLFSATLGQVFPFYGHIATGSSDMTLDFKLSPTGGDATVFFFDLSFEKLFETYTV